MWSKFCRNVILLTLWGFLLVQGDNSDETDERQQLDPKMFQPLEEELMGKLRSNTDGPYEIKIKRMFTKCILTSAINMAVNDTTAIEEDLMQNQQFHSTKRTKRQRPIHRHRHRWYHDSSEENGAAVMHPIFIQQPPVYLSQYTHYPPQPYMASMQSVQGPSYVQFHPVIYTHPENPTYFPKPLSPPPSPSVQTAGQGPEIQVQVPAIPDPPISDPPNPDPPSTPIPSIPVTDAPELQGRNSNLALDMPPPLVHGEGDERPPQPPPEEPDTELQSGNEETQFAEPQSPSDLLSYPSSGTPAPPQESTDMQHPATTFTQQWLDKLAEIGRTSNSTVANSDSDLVGRQLVLTRQPSDYQMGLQYDQSPSGGQLPSPSQDELEQRPQAQPTPPSPNEDDVFQPRESQDRFMSSGDGTPTPGVAPSSTTTPFPLEGRSYQGARQYFSDARSVDIQSPPISDDLHMAPADQMDEKPPPSGPAESDQDDLPPPGEDGKVPEPPATGEERQDVHTSNSQTQLETGSLAASFGGLGTPSPGNSRSAMQDQVYERVRKILDNVALLNVPGIVDDSLALSGSKIQKPPRGRMLNWRQVRWN